MILASKSLDNGLRDSRRSKSTLHNTILIFGDSPFINNFYGILGRSSSATQKTVINDRISEKGLRFVYRIWASRNFVQENIVDRVLEFCFKLVSIFFQKGKTASNFATCWQEYLFELVLIDSFLFIFDFSFYFSSFFMFHMLFRSTGTIFIVFLLFQVAKTIHLRKIKSLFKMILTVFGDQIRMARYFPTFLFYLLPFTGSRRYWAVGTFVRYLFTRYFILSTRKEGSYLR